MSDANTTLHGIKVMSASHFPPDPVALAMLPPESSDLLADAKKIIDWLVFQLEGAEARVKKEQASMDEVRAALDMYATNRGDNLFRQNLELCLQQVRKNRK